MIDVAEALIAARGLSSVSLRDVQREAGQRNKSAAQYHFGTRDGLLTAIVERRMTPVNAARHERLDQLDATTPCGTPGVHDVHDVHAIVEAFVLPLADAVASPDSCYARFLAQVVADPHASEVVVDHLAASSTLRTEAMLAAACPDLPESLRAERFIRLVLVTVTTLAGWEARRPRRRHPRRVRRRPRRHRHRPVHRPRLARRRTTHQEPRMITFNQGPKAIVRPSTDGYHHLSVVPLGPGIGARIDGVEPRGDLPDDAMDEVRRALADWKVLVFRDTTISRDDQRDFALRFGEIEQHPFYKYVQPGQTDVDVVTLAKDERTGGAENEWHADITWHRTPSFGAVLRAVELPEIGGDTIWADMAAAHDALPATTRDRIADLRAVHDWRQSFGLGMSDDTIAALSPEFPPVEHPVVRTHPETGRRVLFVNAIFTSHIVGMDRQESDELLATLYRQATIPEFQYRHRWRAGDVALWDNRSTQHYAVSDYWPGATRDGSHQRAGRRARLRRPV